MPANKLDKPLLILIAAAALCACDGKVTVDLAVTGTDGYGSVVLPPSAVRFQQSGGDVVTLGVGDENTADLNALSPTSTVTLFSGQKLAGADYNGLALDFNGTDAKVTLNDSTVESVSLQSSAYAPVSFSIKKSNQSVERVVVLDLRFSLTQVFGAVEVVPYYRVVDPADDGTIGGTVASSIVEETVCENGRSAGQGVAIYAFAGSDQTPQDFAVGFAGNPVASAQVVLDSSSSSYRYTMPFLASGNYTLALTCKGDEENPEELQSLGFSGAHNATVTAGATTTSDFD